MEVMPYWLDGNNLIGQSVAQAREQPRVRIEFLRQLAEWKSSRGGRITVYFDGDESDPRIAAPGIPVRFSAPLDTDAAMLRRLREIRRPSEVIVVTNDRSLRLRCREAGAAVMDWSQFSSRMNAGRPGSRCESRQDDIAIRDWARYFGLREEDLD